MPPHQPPTANRFWRWNYPIVFEATLEGALLAPAEFKAATAKYHVPDVRFSTRYVLSEAFVTEID